MITAIFICPASKCVFIISYIFNYKLKTIEENIKVCAFPVFTLNKIIVKLEENKINYIIVDRRNNYEVDGKYDNGKLNKYNSYLEKSKKYINQKNKIEEIYNYLISNIENNGNKELLTDIGKLVNERRKI